MSDQHEFTAEHTHEHSHCHSHMHTHEDECTHTHTHTHEHEHTHSHPHHHDGEHAHTHESGAGADRDRKILEYMIRHNEEHASEMKELAGRLREAGSTAAANLIEEAAAGFESANTGLWEAADLLG